MSGMRSKRKGRVGEAELAAILTAAGFPAHRGRQYRGGQDSPDVICPRLDQVYAIEAKRTERLRLYPALEQARQDGGGQRIPLVCHRANGREWVAILPLKDFLELLTWAEGRECLERPQKPVAGATAQNATRVVAGPGDAAETV